MTGFQAAVRTAAVAFLFGLSAGNGHAMSILHFEDAAQGSSAVPGALSGFGAATTTFTDDTATFNSLLTSNSYDLVIFGEQNTEAYEAVSGALGAYVGGGGKLIGTTWRQGGLAGLMGAAFSTGANDYTLETDGHGLFGGLGPVIDLTNPGWRVFNRGWAAAAGSTEIGSLAGGAAAILGNGGNTLLLGTLFDTYGSSAEGERVLSGSVAHLLDIRQTVPEPSVLVLLALALAILVLRLRRR